MTEARVINRGPNIVWCLQGNCVDRTEDTTSCNGRGWKADVSYTLNTINRHAVCAGFKHKAGAKAGSIGYEAEIAPMLNAEQTTAVYDARGNGDGKTVCTLTGDHQSRVTDYTAIVMATGQAGAEITRDMVPTLNCNHEQPIIAHSLRAKANCAHREDMETYQVTDGIVRRLTPLECERLQGYPDSWTDIGPWTDSKGKLHKESSDAARRFAVVGAVEPIYNKNIIIWQITLHAITKGMAHEAEASGLPVSAVPVGEDSDCDTYDGDMSKEDYERMAAAIDIDADRERLTEVQDRIIWFAARRHGIEVELKNKTANDEERKELFDAGMMFAEKQKDRIDEKMELRRALETAGVQALTTEERAKERLEAIRARRAEIAEADQKMRVLEDLDGEDEILAADEMELNAYLDAAVTMAKSEPPADGADPTDDTDDAEAPPEEDEEDRVISVISKGLCPYCGQVVEVDPCTSQTEADEAAAWVCKCAKASAARRIQGQIADAQERVNRLFGEGAVDLGFKPIAGDGVIEVLERLVELIARGSISTAAINIRGQCMAKFSVTSKGKIKVSRSETCSCNLEAGE